MLHQLFKPGLVESDTTRLQLRDLFLIDINTGDFVSDVGETGGCGQTDVAGTDDAESFGSSQSGVDRSWIHAPIVTNRQPDSDNTIRIWRY